MRAPGAIAGALLLSACVSIDTDVTPPRDLGCPTGLSKKTTAELYFGRNIGETLGVSEADWQAFVDAEVTPRFPDGLTIIDATGQWRGPSNVIVREPSKAVMIVLSGAPGERDRLEAVRTAYKTRFRQDAVMIVQRTACVGF